MYLVLNNFKVRARGPHEREDIDSVLARAPEDPEAREAVGRLAPTRAARRRDLRAAALLDRANLTGLVLGCIETKFCK